MPGVGFAERYVIARDSNVVRVDFTRRRDPSAPRFPGAGALRPATRKIAAMDQGKRQARSASLLCCRPLPVPPPQAGQGTRWHHLGVLRARLGST
jgi:hypothetical protein